VNDPNYRPSFGNEEVRLPLIDAKNYVQEDDDSGMTIGSPDRKHTLIDDRINSLLYQSSTA
jgi:hypothetical protein